MPQGLDTFFWCYSVLKQPANDITPWGLKNLVGDAIKTYVSNSSYQVSLQEEGRRCWTLDYSDGVQFHMDVLPAIRATKELYQQELRKLKSYRSAAIGQTSGVASNLSAEAIAITDKQPDYSYVWLLNKRLQKTCLIISKLSVEWIGYAIQ